MIDVVYTHSGGCPIRHLIEIPNPDLQRERLAIALDPDSPSGRWFSELPNDLPVSEMVAVLLPAQARIDARRAASERVDEVSRRGR